MPVSINPATGETIKQFALHTSEEIDRAIANAHRAQPEWAALSFNDRAALMHAAADLLEAKADTLAKLATEEMGKRLSEAKAEVEKCAWVCRYYADTAAEHLSDRELETSASKAYVRHQPLGIILAVMPWNFPFWQVFRFAAPTLMAGNVGMLKHASSVTQCALSIEEIFIEAGFPQGVFTTLLADAKGVEQALEDERVKAVTLTGSEGAGSKVAAIAAKQIKPSLLELGGSDPFIVMDDADIEKAVEIGVKARMINNGQSCIAAKRFIIHEAVYEDFSKRFTHMVATMKVGDPMDDENQMGPLSSKQARDELVEQVERLVKQGATLLCGGHAVEREGFYFQPTVLEDIPEDADGRYEEMFGPVAMLYKFATVEDAIELANETSFGLGSSVWTKSSKTMDAFINGIEAGAVFVNQMVASDPRLPFGGIKRSGYGRELSREGILAFVNAKTVSIA